MVDKNFWEATGYWASGAPTPVKRALRDKVSEHYVNVKDFGASTTNADNWEYFMDATEHLISIGGGILLIPGNLTDNDPYDISQPFAPQEADTSSKRSVIIQGTPGRETGGAFIRGNFYGGIIQNQPTGLQSAYCLRGVKNVRLVNEHAQGRGIWFNNSQGGICEQIEVGAGLIGVEFTNECYNVILRNSIIHGGGAIGIVTSQCSIENTSIVGWDIGMISSNFGFGIRSGRFENCRTAWQLGTIYTCVFMGKNNGADQLEITEVLEGTIVLGMYVVGQWGIRTDHPSGMPYVLTPQVSGTPLGVGVYNVTHPPLNLSPQRMVGLVTSQVAAAFCSDIQMERCNVGLEVIACTCSNLTSMGVSATVGVGREGIIAASWSSAAGGTATVTVNHEHCLETGRRLHINGVNPSGYDIVWPTYQLITKIDATSFSYPCTSDPGTFVTGSGSVYSTPPQFGIRIRTASGTVFSGIAGTQYAELASVDCYYDGNADQYGCTMIGNFNAGIAIEPPGNKKANWFWPVESNLSRISLLVANLPGNFDSTIGAVVGQTYVVTNAAKSGGGTALFGDIVQTATGGDLPGQTIEVKYDGTNWRRSTPSAPD